MNRNLLIIIAVLAIGGAGFLFFKNQSLQNQFTEFKTRSETEQAQLKSEKTKVETELAVLKATDLAKEAELLRLKLANTEKDLGTATKRITELETNQKKAKPYADATSAIDQFFSAPMTAGNLANIDAKISALGDNQVTVQWQKARAGINIQENSWSVSELVDTLFLVNSKIRNLLP